MIFIYLKKLVDGDAPGVAGRGALPRLRLGAGSEERGTELDVSLRKEDFEGFGGPKRGISPIRPPRAHQQEQLQTRGSPRALEEGERHFRGPVFFVMLQ